MTRTSTIGTPRPAAPRGATDVREWATTRVVYEQEVDGYLLVDVERKSSEAKSVVTLTAERYEKCGEEQVGPGDSIYNCTLTWEESVAIPQSAFVVSDDLASATLETMLRGKRLEAKWTVLQKKSGQYEPCEPGGDDIKMGFRHAFVTSKWGSVSSSDEKPLSALLRQASPKSADDPGTCRAP